MRGPFGYSGDSGYRWHTVGILLSEPVGSGSPLCIQTRLFLVSAVHAGIDVADVGPIFSTRTPFKPPHNAPIITGYRGVTRRNTPLTTHSNNLAWLVQNASLLSGFEGGAQRPTCSGCAGRWLHGFLSQLGLTKYQCRGYLSTKGLRERGSEWRS
jgi:hypothetical protein